MISLDQLRKIIPFAGRHGAVFIDPLNAAMDEFGIDTPARQSAFLAQVAHESGSLRYVRELASGDAYDTGRLAARLGNTPDADGDGQRYKGRGLIQITGTDNYRACGLALGLDLLAHPELLEQPVPACRSAAWFWGSRGLNALADAGDFERITRKINGGLNGQADRLAFYQRATEVLA
jgi:putative chitinase